MAKVNNGIYGSADDKRTAANLLDLLVFPVERIWLLSHTGTQVDVSGCAKSTQHEVDPRTFGLFCSFACLV